MRYSTVVVAFLLGGIACSGAMAFEKPRYVPDIPVEQGPFYDPGTGSYFALRINPAHQPYWHLARGRAASSTYKGRRGRLAVIKDLKTLEFIRKHFTLNEDTWIGLQFFCKYRKLMWVDGEVQPLRNPGMWAPVWYRNGNVRCSTQHIAFMPVYLTNQGKGPATWQASGPSKVFRSYLVEYPAPLSEARKPDQAGKENMTKQ